MRYSLDAIDVLWNTSGEVVPKSFVWDGRKITVESVGRQWKDEHGLHVLCMALGEQVFELVLSHDAEWFIRPINTSPKFG